VSPGKKGPQSELVRALLDFAERCGVSRYLIRISVGLDEPQDLQDSIAHFDEALRTSG
jgi:hypothetical protein